MISVRSYLTAGTAAVVGASAIALSPVAPGSGPAPIDLPVPATAAVALTGVTLPLTDVIGVLQTLGGLGGSLTEVLGGFLPQQFINDIVAEVLNQATPVLTTAAGEVVGYLGTALTGLLIGPDSIPARVGAALVDVPRARRIVERREAEIANHHLLRQATMRQRLIQPQIQPKRSPARCRNDAALT